MDNVDALRIALLFHVQIIQSVCMRLYDASAVTVYVDCIAIVYSTVMSTQANVKTPNGTTNRLAEDLLHFCTRSNLDQQIVMIL